MKSRHLQVGLLFIAICIIIGLTFALFSLSNKNQPSSGDAAGLPSAAATDQALAGTPATVAAGVPDFMITDALLRDRPTWEDVGQGPSSSSFCEGRTARLTNGTAHAVTLNVVPNESDASEPLGLVQPGQTITFDVDAPGIWNIADADAGGPLFQYKVTACRNGRPIEAAVAAPEPQAATAMRRGKCRLTVAGTSIIDGECFYLVERGGSFLVANTEDGSGYSAQVEIGAGRAEGRWNGEPGGAPASQFLGPFVRKGPCWGNDGAEVCLWAT